MLTERHRLELVARAIGIVEGAVERVTTEHDELAGVQMHDGRLIRRQALFVPPEFVPHDDLLLALGCEVDGDRWPVKDPYGRTTEPGAWVAGNVANPRAQVVTAAAEGSAAAIAINADLVHEDVRKAVTT